MPNSAAPRSRRPSRRGPFSAALLLAALAGGCASVGDRNLALEEARSAYQAVKDNAKVASLAPVEAGQAREAMQRAEAEWRDHYSPAQVAQPAYLARQRAAIAVETARLRETEIALADATNLRDQLQQAQQRREAEQAAVAAREAARIRAAELERQRQEEAEATRVAAATREQEGASRAQAATIERQVQNDKLRARVLEVKLARMTASNSDRGTVFTVHDDSIFAGHGAQLNPDGARALQRLAEIFKQYPRRKIAIEGFSDTSAGERFDREISQRRADAVRDALLDAGLGMDRVVARGYGRAFPTSANQSAAGRVLNRRIEIVVSEENGSIVSR